MCANDSSTFGKRTNDKRTNCKRNDDKKTNSKRAYGKKTLMQQMVKEKMKHILKEKMIIYSANGKKTKKHIEIEQIVRKKHGNRANGKRTNDNKTNNKNKSKS